MENNSIIEKSEEYVRRFMEQKLSKKYKFHNIEHTEYVAMMAEQIGKAENLSDSELEIVIIAAWFHDTGYSEKYMGHEVASSRIAFEFLKVRNYPELQILKVQKAIMATVMPQFPSNLMEQVLCDADLAHLGKDVFLKFNKNLRNELKNEKIIKHLDKNDWYSQNILFLKNHAYHTDFAKSSFNKEKKKNIKKLKELLEQKNKILKKLVPGIKQNKVRDKNTDRSVQTMFRNNLRGHLDLSGIADNKANIMLSVNAIIISLILPSAMSIFEYGQEFAIPVILLILTCVLTIIFATLSTMPKVTNSGTTTREDIDQRTSNLLFFGNFHNMEYEDFEYGMNKMINDNSFIVSSITKDFYYLGKVLHKKYKYLSLCYKVFMFGITTSVLSFFVVYLLK